jgi:glucose/arabinose dehydrogenase
MIWRTTLRFLPRSLQAAALLATMAVAMLVVIDRIGPQAQALSGWQFTRGTLGISIDSPTSLTFGPDGRLYVASQTEIRALTLNAAGDAAVSTQQIAINLTGVLGIAFDPTTGDAPMTLYASGQNEDAPAGYQGVISKFTAPDWTREDVITGLPTSAPMLNHLTNAVAFDSSGRLLIAQGSASDSGVPDPGGPTTYWHETPLSAAILVADVHAPAFNGHITYSSGPPTNDTIDQTGGDVSVFAAGTRNSYDLVIHSNGHIYATDNGALGQTTSLDCSTDGGNTSTSDELNLIEQGSYYGAPNRNRGRTDPRQCTYRSPQDGNGPDYTAPIAILPNHCSCDGMAEYMSDAFDGQLRGGLIIAQFIRGNVAVVKLSNDGRSVVSQSTLASDFQSPLDVAVSPAGAIYVAEFIGDTVSYLIPDEGTPTPSATPPPGSTATPTSVPTPFDRAGDANCDGSINSIDAALVLQLTAGLIDALPCSGNADASGDGTVNAVDAALILQYSAGLIGHLPP